MVFAHVPEVSNSNLGCPGLSPGPICNMCTVLNLFMETRRAPQAHLQQLCRMIQSIRRFRSRSSHRIRPAATTQLLMLCYQRGTPSLFVPQICWSEWPCMNMNSSAQHVECLGHRVKGIGPGYKAPLWLGWPRIRLCDTSTV